MADKKVIAVVGATGSQGGGLVRAIMSDRKGGFMARAITRDPNSEKARELAKLGAEVVAGNVDDVESLRGAFSGAYGAFCVTFFWEHMSPEREQAQATAMAKAARDTGLKHVIWSTLEDTRRWVPLTDNRMPTLMGKYKVPHLDAKGEIDHVFSDLGVPTTFLLTSFYWDNFIKFGMAPKRANDGRLAVTLPMGKKKLPGIVAEDIGKCAYGIFKRGEEFVGKTVGIAGQHLTGQEIADAFTRAYGIEVVYNEIEPEVFRNFGFPGAEDLGNMFQFKRDFNEDFCKSRSIEFTRSLNPELQTLDQWIKDNKEQMPLESATAA